MKKYHGYIIKRVTADLGEDELDLNWVYEIYDSKGEYINVCLTISNAKEYIDSGFDDAYLC